MISKERIDCSMCAHWTLFNCKLEESHYPNDGHTCARFLIDPTSEADLLIDEVHDEE